jgi:hypothetical protein
MKTNVNINTHDIEVNMKFGRETLSTRNEHDVNVSEACNADVHSKYPNIHASSLRSTYLRNPSDSPVPHTQPLPTSHNTSSTQPLPQVILRPNPPPESIACQLKNPSMHKLQRAQTKPGIHP